jgi:hypothetical protein
MSQFSRNTTEQIILIEKMEDFRNDLKQFKILVDDFLRKEKELKEKTDILLFLDEFKENIDNYLIAERQFMKTWLKPPKDSMIYYLGSAWRNLCEISKINSNKSFRKNIDYIAQIIYNHTRYLEKIEIKT